MSKGVKVSEFLSRTYVQAGLSILGLMVVALTAYALVLRLRDSSLKDWDQSKELLKNFEEMRREGDINEAEFRNIQSLLRKDTELPS